MKKAQERRLAKIINRNFKNAEHMIEITYEQSEKKGDLEDRYKQLVDQYRTRRKTAL